MVNTTPWLLYRSKSITEKSVCRDGYNSSARAVISLLEIIAYFSGVM